MTALIVFALILFYTIFPGPLCWGGESTPRQRELLVEAGPGQSPEAGNPSQSGRGRTGGNRGRY